MKVKVKLVHVKNNQEDFADLIGKVGLLQKCIDCYIFHDLDIINKGKPKEDGDKITIRTKIGNTFTFKRIHERD